MQNPSIEFALQEFPEFSKAELEEMLTKGIRGEARTKEGITKQDIEYFKDNTLYKSEIANYRDEELGMYGDTFHLAKLQKIENVINPTNWEASLKTLLDKALTLAKNKDTLQQAQDLMHSIHLNNPSFFTPLNPNYPKIKEILNEYQERLNTLVAQSPQDIKFIDTKGKEHTLTKEVQEQWLKTFNLKSLDETYIPNFTPEVKQALDSILQGEQIKLTKGSLLKLMQRDRLEFLPYIKDTLESPQVVVRQVDGALIFAKDFRDDKLGKFFASVSKNDNGEWVISSNAPKNLNNLQNKIKEGGEVLYSDLPELPIIAKPELPAKALNSEANLSAIIPQSPQENKPSKVEALKDFMDNARFQVNYAIKAKGTDTALKLIKQMIKDTNNTYEAKFLYRLKNEISSAKELPTKSNLEKDLTQQEIKETIDKWDLSPEANSKGKQRLMVSKVSQAEAEELNKHFNFKGKRDLTREIDSHQIIHTLKQHGDENIEKSRGQIAVNMDDISNYMDIIKNYDFKNIQDNGKIVYAKQINGHHVVLEEVLEGQDKIRFFDMWKQKGELNKEVLLSHSQRPNTSPSLNLERRMPNNTDNNTINTQTTQEGELYVHKRNNRNTSNDILNTSSHWDNMVSHRDDKMQDKYSIDTEGESTSRGEVEEFRGVGNKATHPQKTKGIREKNKGIARELKDIQKKTDNSRIIYNNGFKGGEVAGASDILESGGTTTKPSDLQITYPANHSSGKNPKADSTIKNTNPTQNTSMIHTKEAIKQYLQGFSKHLSNQSKQQIPSVLKEIDSFTNANDIVQYTGAFKKEIQQFIPYLETKEKLEQVLQTPKLQRDPKENLEVSITRIDEKPSKIHLAFDEKGYIPYDTHIAEEFLKQPTTNKDTSTLIDTFIKGAYKKAQKDLSDTYLLDLTGSKIDFGEDITLLNGRELYYKDKQINNEYASPSVLINTAKKLKEGLSDSDLYLAHANKDNLANYHYPYNLLNEYLEDISLLSDWGLADLLVDKSIKQPFNQALDKAFKANGEPFGVLWNNEATKKNLEQNLADYGISINPKDFFVGKNAIDFLLDKQSGYIQSAFHKEGLGDIDLVWGDSNFGLKHILQERTKQWGEEKALRFISHLSENIQKGHIVEVEKGRIGIKTELTTIILDKKDGNNFVITAFRDSGNKKELESLNLIQSKALTSENAGTNAKESPITSLNQDEIIPQTTQEIIKQAKASGKSVAETKELPQKHKQKDSIQDNPQVSALQTKIQQTRQEIEESRNPDKEYLYQVLKPDEIIQLEKQYFNQAMPQEYKELIQDFPSLYEQSLANKLKTYVKDTDRIQEVTTNLLNDFKDKPFKDTAKHAELLLFNTLKDKAQELGFKELDINEPSFKVAFGKFQARLKKGDIQDLSEHIAINSLRKNRLRIQEELNIIPIKEFGTNYAEHYHSGESAIAKLLNEKQGQVSGAFYRKELGDIDLVWGNEKIGLQKIVEKHLNDFADFAGNNPYKKMSNAINEIVENGKLLTENGVNTLWYKNGDDYYLVGISKGFNKQGDNNWIITSYKKDNITNLQKEKVDKLLSSDAEVLSAQGKFNELETLNSTTNAIIPQNANTINILKDMQDKDINATFDNSKLQSEKQGSNSASLTKGETLPLNFKEDSSTKNTKYTIRELKTPSDEELKQITQAYTQDNELLKQRKEIIQSYSNKIEKTKSKKIKQRLRDEQLEKLGQINQKIDDDYALFLRKNGVDTKAMEIKIQLERSERYAKPLFDLLEGFSDKELREYKVRYKNIDTYRDSYLDVGDKRFTEGKGLSISTLQNILLTKLNMSEYPKEIQYAYFDSPLFYHARWGKIETKPDSELIYLGGLSFDEMVMNRERKDLEYLFDIKPIKEFGTNYAEFYKDGKGAIQKLLSEAKDYETRKEAGSLTEDEVKQGAYKGQVAGAFYKEGLGDIDLVWGEVTDPKNHKGYGLAHILDKHPDLDPRLITEIIEKGNLTNQNNIRYRIEKDNYVIGLSAEYKGDKRNFIITAFEKNKDKRDTFTEHPFTSTSDNAVKNLDKKENAESLYTSSAITKGETLPLNSKEDSTTKNTKYTIRELKTPSDEELKQTTQEIIKQAKASGKSVAETKELLQKHKEKDSIQDNPLQSINSP